MIMSSIELSLRPAPQFPKELEFDADWYRKTYKLNKDWSRAQVEDFFWNVGLNKGHNLSPYFNPKYVASQLNRMGYSTDNDPRISYLRYANFIDPHPLVIRDTEWFSSEKGTIQDSGSEWFNMTIFIIRHFDNMQTRHSLFFDPLLFSETLGHQIDCPLNLYLRDYARENVPTSALFDSTFYQSAYPDVARAIENYTHMSQNLLEHFISSGIDEGRLPFADFDPHFYTKEYPDVADQSEKSGFSPIRHFLYYGIKENRNPNAFFNTEYYIDTQPHVVDEIRRLRLFGPFEHFLRVGYKSGLRASQPLYSVDIPERMGKALYEKKCDQTVQRIIRDRITIRFPSIEDTPDISCIIPVSNQGHMTLTLLSQLEGIAWRRDMPSIEVIVVDNGSADVTAELPNLSEGLTVVRSGERLGYPAACNRGAALARGGVLLFMNNDVEVDANAFRYGFERITGEPNTGAVGGKIILTNGALQEAGSMMFLDGSAQGFGRHDNPNRPEYNVVREVDYCSGCFLFVQRDVFQKLNGFDEAYSPGYYEEADFCFRLKDIGLNTIYDPRIEVRHYEYASYSKGRPATVSMALMKRNQKVFRDRHRKRLLTLPVPGSDSWRKRWFSARQGDGRSIAIVEDFIPDPAIGSGFVRSVDVISNLVSDGHRVTLFVQHYMAGVNGDRLRQMGVEVVELYRKKTTRNPFLGREWSFDILWICRTHNIRNWTNWAMAIKAVNSNLKIVFDTEAIAAFRDIAYRKLMGIEHNDTASQLVASELESDLPADMIIAVNEIDRVALSGQSTCPVFELGHRVEARRAAPGLAGRTGLFFCGSFHDENSPNFDSMAWMLREVWPILKLKNPDIHLSIAGHCNPHVRLNELICKVDGVKYIGKVTCLKEYMDKAKVFIAPTRYAGGTPHKIHEALANGVPVVCTDLLRNQLATREISYENIPVLSAPVGDAENFARNCTRLLIDSDLWVKMQSLSFEFISNTASTSLFQKNMRSIINAI
jgi:GT2 family glycosyltransferase